VNTLTDSKKETYKKEGQERMLAMQLLLGANKREFRSAIKDLKNMYLLNKINQYFMTLHANYILLKGWSKKQVKGKGPNNLGIAFTNVGDDDDEDVALVNNGEYKRVCMRKMWLEESTYEEMSCIKTREQYDAIQ